jgi:IS5 family transposase
VPLAIEISGANRRDFQLLEPTLGRIVIDRPDVTAATPQALCLDKGYDYAPIYQLVAEHGLTPHILSRTQEHQKLDHDAGFRARRWVVERTHAWLNRFRGLLIRWSKNPDNHRALIQLACGLIAWRMATTKDLPR